MIALLFFWLGWLSAPRSIRFELAATDVVRSLDPTISDVVLSLVVIIVSSGILLAFAALVTCGIMYLLEKLDP